MARTLDQAAKEVGVNFIGGYSALVQKGFTRGDRDLIDTLPEVLSSTERVCASVYVATTRAGINMDGVLLMGDVIKETSLRTADRDGFGCAKLVVFANMPEDNPFMAGAYLGYGEPETVINVGVSGPGSGQKGTGAGGPIGQKLTLGDLSEIDQEDQFSCDPGGRTDCQGGGPVSRRQLWHRRSLPGPHAHGGRQRGRDPPVPGPRIHRRSRINGRPGPAQRCRQEGGGLCFLFGRRVIRRLYPGQRGPQPIGGGPPGFLSLEKLEAMTAVCSVGLDMIAIPGKVDASTIAAFWRMRWPLGWSIIKRPGCV